jgi:hypothetical protein
MRSREAMIVRCGLKWQWSVVYELVILALSDRISEAWHSGALFVARVEDCDEFAFILRALSMGIMIQWRSLT